MLLYKKGVLENPSHWMHWNVRVWPSTQNLWRSVPSQRKYLLFLCSSLFWALFQNAKWRLIVPQIPHFDHAIKSTRQENLLNSRIELHLTYPTRMRIKFLSLPRRSLSKIVQTYSAVFVTSKHNLLISTGKACVQAGDHFMIREQTGLNRHFFRVKDLQLMIATASNQSRIRGPNHWLNPRCALQKACRFKLNDVCSFALLGFRGWAWGRFFARRHVKFGQVPHGNSLLSIVNNLWRRSEMFSHQRILGQTSVAASRVFCEGTFTASDNFNSIFVLWNFGDCQLGSRQFWACD